MAEDDKPLGGDDAPFPLLKERLPVDSSLTAEDVARRALGLPENEPVTVLGEEEPWTLAERNAALREMVHIDRSGDTITVRVKNTKLGDVSVTLRADDVRGALSWHWFADVFGDEATGDDFLSSMSTIAPLTDESLEALLARVPAALRSLAGDVSSHGITATRRTHPDKRWHVTWLEDGHNEERPFWDE